MFEYLRGILDLPADAAQACRNEGWRHALLLTRNRLLRDLFRRRRRLVLEHDLASHVPVPAPAGVTIESLPASRLADLSGIASRRTLRLFRRRIEAGHTCLVARRVGRAIGYGWIIERVDPALDHYPLPMPASALYLTDLYVLPSERSTGVGAALVSARLRHASERGARTVWRIVGSDNRPSLRAWQKAVPEARLVGTTSYVGLLGRVRASFHPVDGPAPTHAEIVEASRRRRSRSS